MIKYLVKSQTDRRIQRGIQGDIIFSPIFDYRNCKLKYEITLKR